MRLTLLGVGAMASPRYAPAGVLVARQIWDRGGYEPEGTDDDEGGDVAKAATGDPLLSEDLRRAGASRAGPLRRHATQDAVRAFAREIGSTMAERSPGLVSVAMAKTKRRRRVFVDTLRNAFGQTIVAPYSVRRRPRAPVSTPLDGDEVDVRLDPARYNLRTIERRVAAADPWAEFWTRRQRPPGITWAGTFRPAGTPAMTRTVRVSEVARTLPAESRTPAGTRTAGIGRARKPDSSKELRSAYAVFLVRAAFRAAARRPAVPFVATAFRAAALRAAGPRRRAACRAWRARAGRVAAARPSRLSAREMARERVRAGRRRPRRPAREAEAALRRVLAFALLGGGPSLTPARRALLSPIAIACFVDRAPCLPSRTWCISSRTNSPA